MKLLHNSFAIINIIGCVWGILLMVWYYKREVEFKSYERIWNISAFCCISFCFVGALRELYSLTSPMMTYPAWMFKFATSGIYILTFVFYYLVKRYKKIDKEINDNKNE